MMFGYVKVFKPELKMVEYEQYKAVYCSLCRTLGKRYGLWARMTLSYDFTFLALFLMALEKQEVSFEQGRCPFHPLKKRALCTSNTVLDYTADVAMLLVYHKFSDTVKDESFLKRLAARLLQLLYKRDYKRAVKRRPKEAQAATTYMQMQDAVESSQAPCLDACAEPTASFLAAIASSRCTAGKEPLVSRFGYCLGRFIYLADAAQDLSDDVKKGRFNPYAQENNVNYDEGWFATQKQYATKTLHASIAACAECFEELDFYCFQGILANVIYRGLPYVIRQICEQEKGGEACEKSI